ncbi:MAG: autotransporter outer membrane beta-barrel domain-containing protein, partial [Deltaproteobacteria bacterium]|nr:autotransporter outer membrane beta-barrel domain-containing protein [Deltaproteobacteria bacterium]
AGSRTMLASSMSLNAVNHSLSLEGDGYLEIMGNNLLDVYDAKLNGILYFNLSEINPNNSGDPLLTIKTASLYSVDMSGATVILSAAKFNGEYLQAGDSFYLIDAGGASNITTDQATTAAVMRLGHFAQYVLDVKNDDDDQFMMAVFDPPAQPAAPVEVPAQPIEGPEAPAVIPGYSTPGTPSLGTTTAPVTQSGLYLLPETSLVAEAEVAGLSFLAQGSAWLDRQIYRNSLIPPDRSRSYFIPFGGLEGSYLRAGHQSKTTAASSRAAIGVGYHVPFDSSDLTVSTFVEGAVGKYNITADYSHLPGAVSNGPIKAKGDLRSVNGGLSIRQRFGFGLRVELSGRYGVIKNKFQTRDLDFYYGQNLSRVSSLSYELDRPFWAANAGLGYEFNLTDRASLDISARYFLTTMREKSVVVSGGETVKFEEARSKRVRAGARYSLGLSPRRSFYVGGYYERELEDVAAARTHGFDFASRDYSGDTGVAEIGMSFRADETSPWNVEIGLEGYGGLTRGFSGGVSVGYQF